MATFWTGAALAADYGQRHMGRLGASTRPGGLASDQEMQARRCAFRALNEAIGSAVQAQFEDSPPVCWLDDVEEYDWLMHGWQELPRCGTRAAYPMYTG